MKITIEDNDLTTSVESKDAVSFSELFQMFKQCSLAMGYSENVINSQFE